jgi:hypothetical protein
MERTDSYIVVEQMIRRGELGLSELEHLLNTLLQQERITTQEQQVLLELGWGINSNNTPPS